MIVIHSLSEALRFARAAGADAANRRMRAAGRDRWSEDDYAHAVETAQRFLQQLGYLKEKHHD
jgi:hypothetical protein